MQGYGPVSEELYCPLKLQALRIFLKTIRRDLTTFCNVKDLVTCIADAIEAHQPAFDSAHILHCHIRAGLIMITLNHGGFLIKSDECIILTDRSGDDHSHRTGVGKFMTVDDP
ncbi:uncharacterized protein BT62DRAFT_1079287 [Guyanagaster necrorhizus]|uniref:Fungal-type protein kinase domain-containing protein n=1 Tax=Guyanagaster necrorhizus TaxID=856835 RepID=A0A9P8AP04_9AGAR|nr:uncharacterized protein BT62DRAFT_1079287 [Guyanagaster necrorhizus MCA 3950]KAG7442429.1 hypothetical protein BT62DRAFT_1079287 [Guyanagaster necrorhizus MCA 3950]